jgi:alanine dehydrogenase
MAEVLFLDTEDVDGLASPSEYVDAVHDGYVQRGRGAPTTSPRVLDDGREGSTKLVAYSMILPDEGVMGGYVYTIGDASWYVAPIFDAGSGELLSVLDGAYINPIKTGAAGAVGAAALARGDASVLGVLGSAMQAEWQIRAIETVRDLERVKIYSPTPANREALARRLDDDLAPEVVAVGSNDAAIADSDILVTATSAREPIVEADQLTEGMHVNVIGGHGKAEIDPEAIARATYVPDLRESAVHEVSGFRRAVDRGLVTEDHIHAELGDVVAGTAPGRQSPDEITVFDSTGTPVETVAAANLVYQTARERGVGTTLTFRSREEIYG